jgi:hypothetical protein
MATTTKDQLAPKRKLLAAILVERGLMQQKEAILSRYGVERIRDLNGYQLNELIDGLKPVERKRKTTDAPLEVRQARSTVLTLLDDLGIKPKKGNWDAVNNYLKQPRIAGKVLYAMTEEELKNCAVRLRSVIRWKSDKIEAENELARNN